MTLNEELKTMGCSIVIKDMKPQPIHLNINTYFKAFVYHPSVSFRITSRTGVCSQYFLDEISTDKSIKKYHGGYENAFQVHKEMKKIIKEKTKGDTGHE